MTSGFQPHPHDRLHPSLWHPRRCVLRLMRREMESVARAVAPARSAATPSPAPPPTAPTATPPPARSRAGVSSMSSIASIPSTAPVTPTLLDYGCGARPYRPVFAPRFGRYLGADLPGNPEADLTVGPAGEIPLADGAVDCVLSSQVLEHVSDPGLYLREAWRVLRPGGALVLSTHGSWPYHPDPCDYWRWTREGLRLEVERTGFRVESLRGVLGQAATAFQMVQDAVRPLVPGFLRPVYYACSQMLIALADRVRNGEKSNNASTYVVLTRKPSQD